MTRPDTKNNVRSDLDGSTVAQLIECGLVARYDCRPDGLHIVASWPVLARIARRHTDAEVLSSRDVTSLYLHAEAGDWRQMGEGESAFADACVGAAVRAAKEASLADSSPRPKVADTSKPAQPTLNDIDDDDGGGVGW